MGYTESLLAMIKENSSLFKDADNVIDFVYNMAAHQSGSLSAPEGVDSYSHGHSRDKFSGNQMKGLKGAFTTSEKVDGAFVGAHMNDSFIKDVGGFLKSWQSTNGDSSKLIDDFVRRMKKDYGIDVSVK